MRSGTGYPHQVMIIVEYEDGRLHYLTVSNLDLRNGDVAALAIAGAKQQKGDIPPGAIISVKRAH
jgi:hypothetical protein